MKTILNIDERYFSLDGVSFPKIYQPLKQGNDACTLSNIYDSNQVLAAHTDFEEWTVDGNTYPNVEALITALLPITYVERNTVINVGGSGSSGGVGSQDQTIGSGVGRAVSLEGGTSSLSIVDENGVVIAKFENGQAATALRALKSSIGSNVSIEFENAIKLPEVDVTTILASDRTHHLVKSSGSIYFSDGTTWQDLTAGASGGISSENQTRINNIGKFVFRDIQSSDRELDEFDIDAQFSSSYAKRVIVRGNTNSDVTLNAGSTLKSAMSLGDMIVFKQRGDGTTTFTVDPAEFTLIGAGLTGSESVRVDPFGTITIQLDSSNELSVAGTYTVVEANSELYVKNNAISTGANEADSDTGITVENSGTLDRISSGASEGTYYSRFTGAGATSNRAAIYDGVFTLTNGINYVVKIDVQQSVGASLSRTVAWEGVTSSPSETFGVAEEGSWVTKTYNVTGNGSPLRIRMYAENGWVAFDNLSIKEA